MRKLAVLLMIGAGLVGLGASPAGASPFTVNTPGAAGDGNVGDGVCEVSPGNGDCTLAAALDEAIFQGGAVEIFVPSGTFPVPTSTEVDLDLTITGAGIDTVLVPSGDGRHFAVVQGGDLTLQSLTMTGGTGGADNTFQGGGSVIATNGTTVEVVDVHFVDNIAIEDHDEVGEIIRSGGAIYGHEVERITIEGSTFVGNTGSEGGAVVIVDFEVGSVLDITNSTFTDNTGTSSGAAIEVMGLTEATLTNVTVADNVVDNDQAFSPSAVAVDETGPDSPRVTLVGTIIEGSVDGLGSPIDGCNSPDHFFSGGGNVVDDSSCSLTDPTDQADTAAAVGALADNGGPTHTMALTAASPAVDAAGACAPTTDQRDVARPQGDACDSGAYELAVQVPEEPTPPTPTPPAQPVPADPTFTG